jgi:SAM-dependent methyltransferase
MSQSSQSDPIGKAVSNFFHFKDNTPIVVHSSVIEDEELPPDYFFRKYSEMPQIERIALKNCTDRILDVGACAGSHSLYLQKKGYDVTALDISQLCCETMVQRGVKKVICSDVFDFQNAEFDTILLLMNGIGIAGTPNGLQNLFLQLKKLLSRNGKILVDSSDLVYLYEQPDGSVLFDLNSNRYYGEIDYQLSYKDETGQPFSWLFADQVMLSDVAELTGFSTRIIEYGPHYDYLAEITQK